MRLLVKFCLLFLVFVTSTQVLAHVIPYYNYLDELILLVLIPTSLLHRRLMKWKKAKAVIIILLVFIYIISSLFNFYSLPALLIKTSYYIKTLIVFAVVAFLSQRYLDTLKKHRARHEDKGNGFGYLILDRKKDIANTLVIGGMGRERNLIVDKQSFRKCKRKDANTEAVRCLTPREFLNLQGFPEDFPIVVPKTQVYKQVANSVAVPVIKQIALQMKKALKEMRPKLEQELTVK